jgi:hypothetical protein
MTNDAFAAALLLAAIPVGMASGMFGVWLYRTLISALVAH